MDEIMLIKNDMYFSCLVLCRYVPVFVYQMNKKLFYFILGETNIDTTFIWCGFA